MVGSYDRISIVDQGNLIVDVLLYYDYLSKNYVDLTLKIYILWRIEISLRVFTHIGSVSMELPIELKQHKSPDFENISN